MSQEYKQQLLTSTYVPGTGQDNYKCFSMDSLKEFFKLHKVGIRLIFFSGEEITQSIKLSSKIIQLINSRVKTGIQVCLSKKKIPMFFPIHLADERGHSCSPVYHLLVQWAQ